MKLVVDAPINSLSFGNVSINLLREMYKKQMDIALFPVGEQADLDAFNKLDKEFVSWMQESINKRFNKIDREIPTFKLWHINGAERRITPNQYLYTFYELDSPTEVEKSIVKLQNKTIFSSEYARKCFKLFDCQDTTSIPLGFDTDFHKTDKEYLKDKIHFGLIGKFEKRKHTAEIIKAWIKKYGNNYKYQLSCLIVNPFMKSEDLNQIIQQTLGNKSYGNINFIPYLKTNSEVNDLLNAVQIDLSGCSGAEGWNLPSFNSTALGKWSIVLNCSSHKDWATDKNSIMLQPNGKELAADGVFFNQGGPFNQGNIYTFDSDEFISAMEKAESKVNTINEEGLKLQKEFTYEKTLNNILQVIQSDTQGVTPKETA